jgi:hypothetical protein
MRSLPRVLCTVVVLAHAGVAFADEPLVPLPLEPREKGPQVTTLRAVHLRGPDRRDLREEAPDPIVGREPRLDRLQFAKGGLKYQDRFEFNGRHYRFSVRGPVQKDSQLGLTFEIKF